MPDEPSIVATGAANRRGLLLEALCADPTNDAALAVYADALTAANDPRGELIVVEKALAGGLSIRRRAALAARRAELWASYRATWLPYRHVRVRTRHGVGVAAAGTVAALLAEPEVFAREPIFELEVRGLEAANFDALIAAPWLPRIRHLIVRSALDVELFARLIHAPSLAKITTLNVSNNRLPSAALAHLGDALPACRTLVLTGNRFGGGLSGLCAWAGLGKLETLYLKRCTLTAEHVAELFAAAPHSLARVSLSENELGPTLAGALVPHARTLAKLGSLELQQARVLEASVAALRALPFPVLKRLDLRRNRLQKRAAGDDPRILV